MLLGRGAQADSSAVERALWAPNLATEPDRFELDPGAQLRAERIAGETGLELLGVWHSHPRGDARASARDRAGAWSPWWYLIVGLGGAGSGGTGAADFAAWRACVDGALESGRLV